MAYTVGQTVEVCLELDIPPARGVRRVVATFGNEHGDLVVFTDAPVAASECVFQEPDQIGLRGRPDHPGSYTLDSLRVEHLSGVIHMDPPRVGFEVKSTPEVVGGRLA